MSRYYQVNVECKGLTEKQLKRIMVKVLGWDEIGSGFDKEGGISNFAGEGSLYGRQSEKEAHKQIVKEIQKINKKVKVKTTWTYMEDLPTDTYGTLG